MLPLRVHGSGLHRHVRGVRTAAASAASTAPPSLRPLIQQVLLEAQQVAAARLVDQVSVVPLVRFPAWVSAALRLALAVRNAACASTAAPGAWATAAEGRLMRYVCVCVCVCVCMCV